MQKMAILNSVEITEFFQNFFVTQKLHETNFGMLEYQMMAVLELLD